MGVLLRTPGAFLEATASQAAAVIARFGGRELS
jgi:hypothetical protein